MTRLGIIIRRLQMGSALGLSAGMMAIGTACGSSPSPDEKEMHSGGAVDVQTLPWGIVSVSQPRTIRIGAQVGYCVGDPRPRIRRAPTKYRNGAVYIKVEAVLPREKPSDKGLCGGKVLFLYKTITLKRDLADVKVYDSSISPPGLRWPR